jgi:2-polyprenyl-6-methoxyphenol hydroxylase-like FAD-dependent oxidoreductase
MSWTTGGFFKKLRASRDVAMSTHFKREMHLVGDAVHIHSLVGGRGMNPGMEDAACLA